MKILVDMNLSPGWVTYLANAGFEATHWVNVGSPDAPDVELMRWAAVNGYAVLTADLDFGGNPGRTTQRGSDTQRCSDTGRNRWRGRRRAPASTTGIVGWRAHID